MFTDNTTIDIIIRGLILGMIALAFVIVQIRVVGLRSLSKMTSFDFVMTVALGSLIAGAAQASEWAVFAQALLAMMGIFLFQLVMARIRKDGDVVEDALHNEPVLLMRDGEIIHKALKRTRVAESDLIAKLREANVMAMNEVRAVVLETTGDISVLHGDNLEDRLLDGVDCHA